MVARGVLPLCGTSCTWSWEKAADTQGELQDHVLFAWTRNHRASVLELDYPPQALDIGYWNSINMPTVPAKPYLWPQDGSFSRSSTALVIIDMQNDCQYQESYHYT